MAKISNTPSRKEVLHYIAEASDYGNLSLFIGAGFSKELAGKAALSWGALLEKAAEELDIDFDFESADLIGVGYPEIASKLCLAQAGKAADDYLDRMRLLKEKVAELTCWHPDDEKKGAYAAHLAALSPAWIITTNYDLVIESLLPGVSVTIGPDQPLVFKRGRVPVYHLHGVRTYPENIVLCREDYTALFRPNEYRQIKLALMLKESTTVLIGYGLGDDNVLTAFDWSRNVFEHSTEAYPNEVIQVIRSKTPEPSPYRGPNGALIIETNNLDGFFTELMPIVEQLKKESFEGMKKLENISRQMLESTSATIEAFIDDDQFRALTLEVINDDAHAQLVDGFIPFFDKCIDKTFERSADNGAFAGYAQSLKVVLDILCAYADRHIPPALFNKIAHAFNRQAPRIGWTMGQSFEAAALWEKRRGDIPDHHIKELKIYAQSKSWTNVIALLKGIPKKGA